MADPIFEPENPVSALQILHYLMLTLILTFLHNIFVNKRVSFVVSKWGISPSQMRSPKHEATDLMENGGIGGKRIHLTRNTGDRSY